MLGYGIDSKNTLICPCYSGSLYIIILYLAIYLGIIQYFKRIKLDFICCSPVNPFDVVSLQIQNNNYLNAFVKQ